MKVLSFSLVVLFLSSIAFAVDQKLELVELKFRAPVNVKALTILGEAKELKGKVKIEDEKLTGIQLEIPVSSLTTHLSLRDRHMREKIFQDKNGNIPNVKFTCNQIECKNSEQCDLHGKLSVRGKPSQVTIPTKIRRENGKIHSLVFQGQIKLSQYGIKAPQYMGVKVRDEIEFQGVFRTPHL